MAELPKTNRAKHTPMIEKFLQQLRNNPENIDFSETMAVIDGHYMFTETAFTNGATRNAAGENNGSCKLLAFAKLQGLNETETLLCFGGYYRDDVLGNAEGDDHQNIRNFMRSGWAGVQFAGEPLAKK